LRKVHNNAYNNSINICKNMVTILERKTITMCEPKTITILEKNDEYFVKTP